MTYIQNVYQVLQDWFLAGGYKIAVILVVTLVGLKILHIFTKRILKATIKKTYDIKNEKAIQKRVDTLDSVSFSAIKVVVWITVALIILAELGINIGPFIAVVGIIGLAIGFGGQYLIRDLISGLFIILEDQYRKGDVITIGKITGKVDQITLRKTTLRDIDGAEHHIPNGEIKTISNLTKQWSRVHLEVRISYDSDLIKAMKILDEIGIEISKEKDWKDIITEAPKAVGVQELAASAVIIRYLGDTIPSGQWDAMRELRKRIKLEFDKQGI